MNSHDLNAFVYEEVKKKKISENELLPAPFPHFYICITVCVVKQNQTTKQMNQSINFTLNQNHFESLCFFYIFHIQLFITVKKNRLIIKEKIKDLNLIGEQMM